VLYELVGGLSKSARVIFPSAAGAINTI
jgi:hypothetical protein